jgi:ribosomal protein S18 acetylase RimI-like enzyme
MKAVAGTQLLTYRSLNEQDISQMHQSFIEAFADYFVPFNLGLEAFTDKMIKKLDLNFELSCGAFDGDKLVGFLFTGVAEYEGKKTAYNGGTGVIPEYRGRQVTSGMYEFLLLKFRQHLIEQSVLEVITLNHKAIKAYQRVGFKKSKYYRCFKLEQELLELPLYPEALEIEASPDFDWKYYKMFHDTSACFSDSPAVLPRNLENEQVLYAKLNGQTVGYVIFQPKIGRISQIAVSKAHRRKGIGRALLAEVYKQSANQQLTLINVENEQFAIIHFLENFGFTNQIDQYEMVLKL